MTHNEHYLSVLNLFYNRLRNMISENLHLPILPSKITTTTPPPSPCRHPRVPASQIVRPSHPLATKPPISKSSTILIRGYSSQTRAPYPVKYKNTREKKLTMSSAPHPTHVSTTTASLTRPSVPRIWIFEKHFGLAFGLAPFAIMEVERATTGSVGEEVLPQEPREGV